MARVKVKELQENTELSKAPFLLAAASQVLDRNGDKYLKLVLRDKTGEIAGRYWRVPAGVYEQLKVGEGVAVSGRVTVFRGSQQVNVTHIFACPLDDVDEYLPTARRPREEMIAELQGLISSLSNPYLRRLLQEVLGDVEFQARFLEAPAAIVYHHACVGGLLEHSLDVVRQILSALESYPEIDRDLAVTVGLLHDVGKVDSYDLRGAFEINDVGRLLGHIYVGAARVEQAIDRIAEFPEELRLRVIHAILSHHGDRERGSPVIPRTPEAILLHHADNLDGTLRGWIDHVQRESVNGEAWTSWSTIHGGELYIGKG
jgi:3'-5' exoribonuclease